LDALTTQIVFLGTGTPNPDPDRQGPSLAIIVNGQPYLVDCGPGVVRQAAAANLGSSKLDHLFVTHLHTDHTLGYPDLIFSPAVTGRQHALRVWGPPGIREMTEHLKAAYSQDYEVRIHGGEPVVPAAYDVEVEEISPGIVFQDANVTVKAFLVSHGQWKNAFGFRFETPDRTIVISGDTTYCQNLIDNAMGCDVLVHEVYSALGLRARTADWQAYHSAYHTSGYDVGRIASIVQPKLVLLYHMLPFGQPESQVVAEVRSEFSGAVVVAEDLAAY
jgi:ribonuclease BN (tRNA processing enzyme)